MKFFKKHFKNFKKNQKNVKMFRILCSIFYVLCYPLTPYLTVRRRGISRIIFHVNICWWHEFSSFLIDVEMNINAIETKSSEIMHFRWENTDLWGSVFKIFNIFIKFLNERKISILRIIVITPKKGSGFLENLTSSFSLYSYCIHTVFILYSYYNYDEKWWKNLYF